MKELLPHIVSLCKKLTSLTAKLMLLALLGQLCINSAQAAGISSMRIGQGVGNVRIVFDADRKFDYNVFLLSEPKRLVVDTFNVPVSSKIEKQQDKNNLLSSPRLGTVGVDGTRIVFDLKKPVIVKKAFNVGSSKQFWMALRGRCCDCIRKGVRFYSRL